MHLSYLSLCLAALTLPYIVQAAPLAEPHPAPIAAPNAAASSTHNYDVVIYGGTSTAFTAAVQVKRLGKTVAIVCPDAHVGGMTIAGLGWTDSKNGSAIGGIAREFYQHIYTHYDTSSAWTAGSRALYIKDNIQAQPGVALDTAKKVQWTFEPHVAQSVIKSWLASGDIPVFPGEYIDRSNGVVKSSRKITAIKMLSGKTFTASQFIDAGYEGDLMATAGVSYLVGRDSESDFGESLAGQRIETAGAAGGYSGVDPYVRKGDASSDLIKGIEGPELTSTFPTGAGDNIRLQSFNYRLCLTQQADNRVDFTEPAGYEASEFEIVLRLLEAGHTAGFTTQQMPNYKTDSNSVGEVSLDFVGGNFNFAAKTTYSESSYDERKKIVAAHKAWQQGLMWTLKSNSRVPEAVRDKATRYGLAKDEFTETDNWPAQLYVREARRMQGLYMMTQMDVQDNTGASHGQSIGMGSYSLDSHVVRRVVKDGIIYDEGGFYVKNPESYAIPYQSIVPKKSEATNLLNPVTLSATHVATGSIRMEPTYMILGQSAAIAAVLAIEENVDVQDVPASKLKSALAKGNQIV